MLLPFACIERAPSQGGEVRYAASRGIAASAVLVEWGGVNVYSIYSADSALSIGADLGRIAHRFAKTENGKKRIMLSAPGPQPEKPRFLLARNKILKPFQL